VKKLVITTEKGGVGKTADNVQLAFYLATTLKQRVMVLDLDVQNNASSTITKHGLATVAPFTTFDVLTRSVAGEQIPKVPFLLVPEGERETLALEARASDHQAFADNLVSFLDAADPHFDFCIMDTGPRAEICHNLALITADYFLAPMVLSQHAIDGVRDILYSEPWGYEHIRDNINRELKLIGILPSMVDAKPMQKGILQFIKTHPNVAPFLLKFDDQDKTVAQIPRLQAVEEAQNKGLFLGDMTKTSGRDAWRQIKPVFDLIIRKMQVEQ
jgi:chromosome partitioning protein